MEPDRGWPTGAARAGVSPFLYLDPRGRLPERVSSRATHSPCLRTADAGSVPCSATNQEAPTTLGWGSFSSDRSRSCVLSRVRAKTCGLRRSAIWLVPGHLSLSPGHSSPGLRSPRMARSPQGACLAPLEINGLHADRSRSWIASLPTRRGQCRSRKRADPAQQALAPT
jgi:hypothetical protein